MSKLVYWEIPTKDVQATSAFLAGLFGWKMQPSSENYMMFEAEEGVPGGIQQVDETPAHGIGVYISVDDIPATLARVEALGGKTVHPKTEIGGGYGYWADFTAAGDSCRIGLWSKT